MDLNGVMTIPQSWIFCMEYWIIHADSSMDEWITVMKTPQTTHVLNTENTDQADPWFSVQAATSLGQLAPDIARRKPTRTASVREINLPGFFSEAQGCIILLGKMMINHDKP